MNEARSHEPNERTDKTDCSTPVNDIFTITTLVAGTAMNIELGRNFDDESKVKPSGNTPEDEVKPSGNTPEDKAKLSGNGSSHSPGSGSAESSDIEYSKGEGKGTYFHNCSESFYNLMLDHSKLSRNTSERSIPIGLGRNSYEDKKVYPSELTKDESWHSSGSGSVESSSIAESFCKLNLDEPKLSGNTLENEAKVKRGQNYSIVPERTRPRQIITWDPKLNRFQYKVTKSGQIFCNNFPTNKNDSEPLFEEERTRPKPYPRTRPRPHSRTRTNGISGDNDLDNSYA